MKKPILFSLTFVFLLVLYSYVSNEADTTKTVVSGGGITFFTGTWKDALAKAKQDNRIIFFDAYASWCGPCKMMKRLTFSDAKVGEFYNANFINVMMDMEQGEGVDLSYQFGIEAYPTLLFIDGDGKIVHKQLGYHNSEQFIALGKQIIK